MIDNDVLTAAVDAAYSVDYGKMYRAGVVALFYCDGLHRAAVTLQGTDDSEIVAVAGLAPAVGADQMVWTSGAVYSETMDNARLDPAAVPVLAYLAARRDLTVAYYRRELHMLDDGTMPGRGPLHRRSHEKSRWAALVIVPWVMDQPEGDADKLAALLGDRGHRVTII